MRELQAGNWYFGVVCRGCQEPILFGSDESFGAKPYAVGGRRRLRCEQESCGLEATYRAGEFRSFRVPKKS